MNLIKKLLKYKNKILISIEGNIGVGKTSIIDLLKKTYSDIAEFIYEPIEEWLKMKMEKIY